MVAEVVTSTSTTLPSSSADLPAGELLTAAGLVVGIVATVVLLLWPLRPGVLRYGSTIGGVIEWRKLQRDQWLLACAVLVSLVLQLLGLVVA